MMTPLQLSLLTFVSVTAAIGGIGMLVYEKFFKYRDQVGDRLDEEFGRGRVGVNEQTRLFKDLSKIARPSEAGEGTWRDQLEQTIEQAGMSVTVRQVVLSSLILAAAIGTGIGVASRSWWMASLAAAISLPAAYVFVTIQRNRRLSKIRQQLPDAFEMMSRSISAGQTITRAFQTIADDFEAPLAEEFAWCFEQQNLGLAQDVALRDLARRVGVPELQMLVVALLVQRQTGGSPVEMLNNLAEVVRQRIELQEKVRSLTAEGRMQAAVLLLLPPLLLAIISLLNPEYVSALWERPRLLALLACSELVGIAWIRQILSLDY